MTDTTSPESNKKSALGFLKTIRNRIIAGLFVVLPIFITFAVIKWLYETLYALALQPISYFLKVAWGLKEVASTWQLEAFLSIVAFGAVLGVLFVAGILFRSRLHQLVNWVLLNVPGVRIVYSAVNNVFIAISSSQTEESKFQRVVLVQFPHPGMKAPAFVTGECQDIESGKTILCVYVPTTPIPTSGYMLLVPQEDVVDLNWDLEETLQAIVSGGITVPETVSYTKLSANNIATIRPV